MDPIGFNFRPVRSDDFASIKSIHMDLFPIQYGDEFLINASNGVGLNGDPLFSSIVTAKDNDAEIIGFIFCQFISREKCEEREALDPASPATQTCYILTLGIIPQYRRTGLGNMLLMQCIDYARSSRNCGMVYLHVIEYNLPGIYFYEKHGFLCSREIPEFYRIKGADYAAFAYTLFINDNYPTIFLRIYGTIRRQSISVWTILRSWVQTVFTVTSPADAVTAEYMDGEAYRHIREIPYAGKNVCQNDHLI